MSWSYPQITNLRVAASALNEVTYAINERGVVMAGGPSVSYPLLMKGDRIQASVLLTIQTAITDLIPNVEVSGCFWGHEFTYNNPSSYTMWAITRQTTDLGASPPIKNIFALAFGTSDVTWRTTLPSKGDRVDLDQMNAILSDWHAVLSLLKTRTLTPSTLGYANLIQLGDDAKGALYPHLGPYTSCSALLIGVDGTAWGSPAPYSFEGYYLWAHRSLPDRYLGRTFRVPFAVGVTVPGYHADYPLYVNRLYWSIAPCLACTKGEMGDYSDPRNLYRDLQLDWRIATTAFPSDYSFARVHGGLAASYTQSSGSRCVFEERMWRSTIGAPWQPNTVVYAAALMPNDPAAISSGLCALLTGNGDSAVEQATIALGYVYFGSFRYKMGEFRGLLGEYEFTKG